MRSGHLVLVQAASERRDLVLVTLRVSVSSKNSKSLRSGAGASWRGTNHTVPGDTPQSVLKKRLLGILVMASI